MIRFKPKQGVLGAVVENLSLSTLPSENQILQIETALEKYGVLIFQSQFISPAEQIAFSRAFAELELTTRKSARLDENPEIFVVGNVDGQIVSFAPNDGSQDLEWHSDHMHLSVPARASLLYCIETPPVGGDTHFACMYSAYDSLSKCEKIEADNLKAVHSASGLTKFLNQKGAEGSVDRHAATKDPVAVTWPLVRKHPLTHRKSLFFGSKVTISIDGWSQLKALRYISSLTKRATIDEFCYTHKWQPGDALLWDNRRVLHAATPFNMNRYKRRMHRTTWRETDPII